MTWAKVDDRLHGHSKARRAGTALALWVLAMSWCASELTDGLVPLDMPSLLIADGDAMAEKLVSVGLWERTEGGYRFVFGDDLCRIATDQSELDAMRAAARRRFGLQVKTRDGNKCVYCSAADDLTLDHVVPLSRGGSNTAENLVTACRSCNSSKGAKVLS